MYISVNEVYGIAGISSSEISEAIVESSIQAAESVVDRLTNSTYLNVENNGTASGGSNDTIVDSSKTFDVDTYANEYVWVHAGTGKGQLRLISSNTATTLTVDTAWSTNPDDTSKYRIVHTGSNAHVEEEVLDGDNTATLFLDKYPLISLVSASSNSISITVDNIYQYKSMGKLVLGNDTEASYWSGVKPLQNELDYWYGVYPIINLVKRLTGVYAALFILQSQMGGTHNIPSTYSLPEGSLSVGQAYINIKGTWDTLMRNKAYLEDLIPKYPSFSA